MSNYSHGMAKSKVYAVWCGMIKRCFNEKDSNYPIYGARGIKVCDEWLKFENFFNDMGNRPEGMSIDRIDVNGDYNKSNCKWSTRKEQARNTRTNRFIEFNGDNKCLMEWSEVTGISVGTIWYRLNSGWTIEKTLTTEVRKLTNKTMRDCHE